MTDQAIRQGRCDHRGLRSEASVSLSPMSRTLAHRPVLDGLRGVAVAAVVAYHLRPDALPGGFIGVDVFFVLSGFLITSLLLLEAERDQQIDLGGFVVRRGRRLAPAMLLVVAAVAAFAARWASPFELSRLRTHGLWTLFSLANWRFIHEGVTYTDVVVGASPLRHVWSLSIEEQFYVVLPVTLWLLTKAHVRHLRQVVLWGALVLAAGSAVWAAWLSIDGADIARTYFGTDTRAQALLLGVALGAALRGRPIPVSRRRPAMIAALIGITVLVTAALVVGEQWTLMPRGGFLLVAVASAAVIAGAEHVPPLHRLLTTRVLTGLGAISYGMYLWHWPVIVIVDGSRTGWADTSHGLLALRLVLMLALSLASYFLVERPIRAGALRRRLGAIGGALSWPLATAAVAITLVVATAPPSIATSADHGPGTTAEVGPTTTEDPDVEPVHLLLFGDSVAHSLAGGTVLDFPKVEPWRPEQATVAGLTAFTRPGCAFMPGNLTFGDGIVLNTSGFCGPWRTDLAATLADDRPTHMVVLLENDVSDHVADGTAVTFGSDTYVAQLHALLDELRAAAERQGAEFVLLSSAARPADNPRPNAARAEVMQGLLQDYAAVHGVLMIPLADAPTTARFDGIHYTWADGRTILTWVIDRIRDWDAANP